MRKLVIVVAACAAFAACKKDGNKTSAEPATPVDKDQTDEDKTAETADKDKPADPWASAPDSASTLGAGTGAGIAKLDLAADRAKLRGDTAPGGAPINHMKDGFKSIMKPQQEGAAIQSFAGVKQTGFRVVYNDSESEVHQGLKTVLEENRVFETLAEALNGLVRLPHAVDVQVVDCGTINAFYDPNAKRIIVCYELMTYFAQIFSPTIKDTNQLGMAVIGATTFAFFHEVGHGLIDILDLPAVGREEDSVDQLATMILIADGDSGVGLALSGAHWFELQEKAGTNKMPFSDEHAFDMQRFFNILCMVYGSDPQKYGDFVTSGTLPEARAARCPEEFGKIRKSWEKLLSPYMTNDAAANVDYKPAIDPSETIEPTDPQPTSGASITCEAVAVKAIELIGEEAIKKAESMTPEEVEDFKAKLEAELPAFAEQFLAQCAKEDWPDKDRQCVLDATSLEQASKCGIQ
jgi:hypothetical protein